MSDLEQIDMTDDKLVERFMVAGSDALEAQAIRDAVERRRQAMMFAMGFHTNGEGDPNTTDALEVARTAETFDRFLRGDGVAEGKLETLNNENA